MVEAKPIIACFDLAGKVGVATGVVGGRPRLETWVLAGDSRPEKLVRLDDLIETHFASRDVDLAYYEAPLAISVLMDIGAREETVQLLRSAVAVLEQRCARREIPVKSWAVQTARRSVIGQGRFPKGTAKRNVMRYCQLLGYKPADDNQADALIGFLYESALLNPRTAHLTAPLFAAVR